MKSSSGPFHVKLNSEYNSEEADKAYREFRETNPEYESSSRIDESRAKEYPQLGKLHHVYLDYTGGGLYSQSQLEKHLALLRSGIFGNPHSNSPSSLAATHLIEDTRRHVLEYFNASPDEYVVIFTQNASGALKLIGEAYPFDSHSRYVLTFDNHNAVNGIREYARSKGAAITYVPVLAPDLQIDGDQLLQHLNNANHRGNNLFVYPAQSNFSGVQHSMDWIDRAHSMGWDVILDAAAFVPTNRLDLKIHHPDFVPLSFYKMFGYPTGVGCLIAKKNALKKLRRPWFSGGTIEVASVQGDVYHLAEGSTAFEDGTINYLILPALDFGLSHLQDLTIELVHKRVHLLTGWLLQGLLSLVHANGAPVVEIYGPRHMMNRGGTIAMNFQDPYGRMFNFHLIEEAAGKFNISIRTGCFCNPGAGEIAFGLTKNDMIDCFGNEERTSFEHCILAVKGKTAGAVRVSLGLVTNFHDIYRFLQFAQTFINQQAV
jgi:molybdenum cofactor sulfurtransferase